MRTLLAPKSVRVAYDCIWHTELRWLKDFYAYPETAWDLLTYISDELDIFTEPQEIGMPSEPFSQLQRRTWINMFCGCGCYFGP